MEDSMRKFSQELEKWASKQTGQSYQTSRTHLHNVKRDKEVVGKLVADQEALQQLLKQQLEENEEDEKQVQDLQAQIEALAQQLAVLPRNVTAADADLRTQRQVREETAQEMRRALEERSQRMQELQRGVAFFRQRLGLDFETVEGGMLRVTYKYIDPRDDYRPFSFLVRVGSDSRYEISAVTPSVGDVQAMQAKLNAVNDFAWFVQAMRRRFKSLCL